MLGPLAAPPTRPLATKHSELRSRGVAGAQLNCRGASARGSGCAGRAPFRLTSPEKGRARSKNQIASTALIIIIIILIRFYLNYHCHHHQISIQIIGIIVNSIIVSFKFASA